MPLRPLTARVFDTLSRLTGVGNTSAATAVEAQPEPDSFSGVVAAPDAQKSTPADVLPFSQGAQGGLSPAQDFARFLGTSDELKDPTEADLEQKLHTLLLPYLKTARFGEFAGERGVPIRYLAMDPPAGVPVRGIINIASGRTESFVKYVETLYNLRDLRADGYVLAMMDHRGQGFSGRELDEAQKGYVVDFEDYVRDEHRFTELLKGHFGSDVPRTVVAFSMGGAIAALQLEQYPDEYQKAVFLSPMFDVRTPFANPMETFIADTAGVVSPTSWAPRQLPYRRGTFEQNHNTNSRARFAMQQTLFDLFPQTAMGGATWGFLRQAVGATRRLMRGDAIDRLKGVAVTLMRSTADALVEPEAQNHFAERLGIQPESYYGADGSGTPHDLLNLVDEVRTRAIARLRTALTA